MLASSPFSTVPLASFGEGADVDVLVPSTAFTLSATAPEVTVAHTVNVPASSFVIEAGDVTVYNDEMVFVPSGLGFTLSAFSPRVYVDNIVFVGASAFELSATPPIILMDETVLVPASRFGISSTVPDVNIDGYASLQPHFGDFYTDIAPVADLGETDGIPQQ